MPWYAVHTKPRQEERVVARVAETGVEAFLPKLQVRRKRHGRGMVQIEPLFPGYLFISAMLTLERWDRIRWTPGVKAVLGCDGVPSAIPESLVASIKQRIGADGVFCQAPAFGPGDRVRLIDGPFAGFVGVLERTTSRAGRVRVLLDVLRGAVVELEDVDLELAS